MIIFSFSRKLNKDKISMCHLADLSIILNLPTFDRLPYELYNNRKGLIDNLKKLLERKYPCSSIIPTADGYGLDVCLAVIKHRISGTAYSTDIIYNLIEILEDEQTMSKICERPTARQTLYYDLLDKKSSTYNAMTEASIHEICLDNKRCMFRVVCSDLNKVVTTLPKTWIKLLEIRIADEGGPISER
jgi:hypothetical protein